MGSSTFITRVALENYKSIARCDVSLGALTFLVGANGSGKSNFLDALRFVADSLRNALDHAIRERGGIKEVRLRSSGHPTHFGIRLEFSLRTGQRGFYAFRIAALREGGYEVQREECSITSPEVLLPPAHYLVERGEVIRTSLSVAPAASSERLYLVNASGLPEFRLLYQSLSNMGFYNLNPDQIRDVQPPDVGDILLRDGSNIASVLAQLATRSPKIKERIEEYLGKVVLGIQSVDAKSIGSKETLEFKQQMAGSKHPWGFLAGSMSDGTLRAVGVLVALFQSSNGQGSRVPLVGIEEPEVALHPAAAGVLLDALGDASRTTQVVVTSHSPELLDDHRIAGDAILAVLAEKGITQIGPLDEVGRSALRDRLYTPGELLRLNQLAPDAEALQKVSGGQLNLFDKHIAG
jgi:predicted ATPase